MAWKTTHQITCITDKGERVVVFRMMAEPRMARPQHIYVLQDNEPLQVIADSRFKVTGTTAILRPMNI